MVLAPILYRKFIYPGLKAGAIHIKSPPGFFKSEFPAAYRPNAVLKEEK
jgi:hypothetical protein